MFSLRLFGGILLEGPCGPLSGRVVQRRQVALLALLALARHGPVSRDKLIGIMWPDSDEERARHHLSDALYVLHEALGEQAVLTVGDALRLNPEVVRCDVCEFEAAVARGELEAAVAIYTGRFLDGFYPRDAKAFEDWLEAVRERLAAEYRTALESLAERAEAAADYKGALEWWRKLVAEDPYNSRFAVHLAQAMASAGDRANAVRYLRQHQRRLRDELGIESDDAILALSERLRLEATPPGPWSESRQPRKAEAERPPTVAGPAPRPARPFDETHRRALWPTVLVYVAGGLPAQQVASALTARLGLPGWFPGLAIVLLLLGLVITVVTVSPAALERRRHWHIAGLSYLTALAIWALVATTWLGVSGDLTTATTKGRSVAVIPFRNLSAEPETGYLSDGFSDELITHLATIADLKVISRQSVAQYKGDERNFREIGAELGVATILTGAMLKSGDRVRVHAQLVEVENEEYLWAQTYDRDLPDILAIQTDIARAIAIALQATLTPAEVKRIERRPTDSQRAYDYFLRANDYLNRSFMLEDLHTAEQLYQATIEQDTAFGLAYARLSIVHSRMHWYGYDPTAERASQAQRAADRAHELDPELPEAHLALAYCHYQGRRDYEAALRALAAAQRLQPGSSDILAATGYVQRHQGDWEGAIANLERAFELNPRSNVIASVLGNSYVMARKYAEAERYLAKAISLAPDQPEGCYALARLYLIWTGELDKVTRALAGCPTEIDPAELPTGSAIEYWRLLFILESPEALLEALTPASVGETEAYYHLVAAELHGLLRHHEQKRLHYDSTRAYLEGWIEQQPGNAFVHARLGTAYAGLDRRVDALRQAEIAERLLPVAADAVDGARLLREVARIYVMTGDYDTALDRVECLLETPSLTSVNLVRLHPHWDPLRDHPRFQALLRTFEAQPQ